MTTSRSGLAGLEKCPRPAFTAQWACLVEDEWADIWGFQLTEGQGQGHTPRSKQTAKRCVQSEGTQTSEKP